MASETLLIRADASVATGSGHVMRCLALAQAWQDSGGEALFCQAESTPAIQARLQAERVSQICLNAVPGSVEDADSTARLATEHSAKWVAVDGYAFGADYQRALKDAGLKVLFIDDNGHADHYFADLVLNQNAHANEAVYGSREPQTRLLMGGRYAMLRREFVRWRDWEREISPRGYRVLITMGGSDPGNVTEKVLRGLAPLLGEVEVLAVIGGSNPHAENLGKTTEELGSVVRFEKDVANMPEFMAWADIAISAAGSTCWELCALGLPAMVIDAAPNQKEIACGVEGRGAAIHLGSGESWDSTTLAGKVKELLKFPETRSTMSCHGRMLVDGRGAERVIAAMRAGGLQLRRAAESDCKLLWQWANESGVRESSLSTAFIPWENHMSWFEEKLQDPKCQIFIASDERQAPVGQLRLDSTGHGEAELAISIAVEKRGAGYGCALLEMATSEAFTGTGIARLHAFIKPENAASIRTFEQGRFRKINTVQKNGCEAVHYMRDKYLA